MASLIDNYEIPSAWEWLFEGINQQAQRTLGSLLRDHAFFPSPRNKFPAATFQQCQEIFDSNIFDNERYPLKAEILDQFSPNKKIILFNYNGQTLQAVVYIMSSNPNDEPDVPTVVRVGGADEELDLTPIRLMPYLDAIYKRPKEEQQICIVQFSFFNLYVQTSDTTHPWKAPNFKELGDVFFSFLEALKTTHSVYALLLHSMGSAVLHDIENRLPDQIPKKIICDRAYTSTSKVANNFNFILRNLLYPTAVYTGWAGDPEASIAAFSEKTGFTFINIQVDGDVYFSGQGAFSKDLPEKLRLRGVNVFQRIVRTNPLAIHERATHAVLANCLFNDVEDTQDGYTFHKNESVACFIARVLVQK